MATFLALLLGSPLAARETVDATPIVDEIWYQVAVGGQPAGFLVLREIEHGDTLISESDLKLTFSRGGTSQSIGMASRFVESLDHQPRSFWTRQAFGAMPLETTYTFGAEGVEVAGPAGTRTVDPPAGGWLTPHAAQGTLERHVERLLAAEDGVGQSFEMTVLDPSLGIQPVSTTYVLEAAEEPIEILGETVSASRWRQTQSYAPQLVTTVHLAADGTNLRSQMSVMGMDMTVTRSRRDIVQASTSAPELLVQTFVYPDRRLDDPRALRRAVYRLSAENGTLPPPPETAIQTVATAEDGAILVTIDLAGDPGADAEPAALDDPERYLRATTQLGHTSEAVRAVYSAAVAEAPADASPARRAETLRRAVARHLSDKNLDSVLATAEEAASQRSGDCTEHAVLLAALLRADGIPSRIATGLIYVDAFAGKRDLFAYHMWSQAFLDGRWVDLDATLDDDTPFDAAHLTLGTSALDDDGSALIEMAGAAPWIGRLQLEVVEVGRRSK